jgi:hypothetical protein
MTPGVDSLDDARRFIVAVEWRFAKTMAHYNPHWYVVERDNAEPEFTAFVAFVRSGPIRRYRGGRYHCVEVDQWAYWLTHAGSGGGSSTANEVPRRAGNDVATSRDRRELIWHDVERELMSRERAEELLRELGDQELSPEEAHS